jgi:hypothetical protein
MCDFSSSLIFGAKPMKLNYRGVAYDYTPPEVAVQFNDLQGSYRGTQYHFHEATAASSLEQDADLIYRGVAYHVGHNAAVAAQQNVDALARELMMAAHTGVKNREQSLLARATADMGLGEAASHYWSHIQGKINPSLHASYDRNRVAFS